ncbi:hypothetical protein HO173_011938 [Letharia columbiana]|uniref:Uncharacterized protein n=1 Tax=Letharia columbiana TaxID=112416 RepID=A0A8H6CRD0_9LECA|nr:uncharacterized protein HO173_011938 [Letharia columbiana]KAF6227836.1 hypothetical protein HO173_011938 [Letharia columbiana]
MLSASGLLSYGILVCVNAVKRHATLIVKRAAVYYNIKQSSGSFSGPLKTGGRIYCDSRATGRQSANDSQMPFSFLAQGDQIEDDEIGHWMLKVEQETPR